MESTESPLEVLSRAATMVQDSSPPDYDCARPCGTTKELPSGRWRRERRDKTGAGYARQRGAHAERPVDAPLDMTTPRGLPPPYSACVGSRAPKSPARPSVITCAPTGPPARPGNAPTGHRREQLSDPVIDEHFRRSLGNDYKSLYQDGGDDKASNSITVTGLSVDDHFAKALGDTWAKLQKSESGVPIKRDPGTSPPAQPAPTVANSTTPTATNNNTNINNNNNSNNNSKDKAAKSATAATLLQQRRGLVTI